MIKGKITSIPRDKKYIFIDRDIFCHMDKIKFKPSNGMKVSYDVMVGRDGRKSAINVAVLQDEVFINYMKELNKGYFNDAGYLKEDFSIKYPIYLAILFSIDAELNKPSQIRGFFEHCILVLGNFKFKKQFEYVKYELSQLDAMAAYALNRENISQEFCDFFKANLELAKQNEKNFMNGFMPHFQNLIAYYTKNN